MTRGTEVVSAALPFPNPARPAPPRVPRPARWVLGNGLRVVAVPWTTLPQVGARLIVPAGAACDPDGLEGTAAFVGAMLTEGTERTPADELNAALDRLGASLTAGVGHDFAEIDLFLLAETLPEAMQLLAETVRFPAFPEGETARVRAETLDALAARVDEPANVADDRLGEAVFGRGHPYARPPLGTSAAVEAISRDALAELHALHYQPDGAALIVAGDFEVGALRELIDSAWGDWNGTARAAAVPEQHSREPGADVLRVGWAEAAQGELRLGGPGMPRSSPDWVPAGVANYLLGGSTITGRLGANLREDKGWTYGIRSGFGAALRSGGWVIETAVDAEFIDRSLQEIDRELSRLVREEVPLDELRRAKDALILSLPRAFETPGRIIGRFATVEAFGLGEQYWDGFAAAVEAVTAEQVRSMAERYFHPDQLARVVVGPPPEGETA
jgi:zinc protease